MELKNISDKACIKNNTTKSEIITMILYEIDDTPKQTHIDLVKKGYVTQFGGKKDYAVTNKGKEVLQNVLLESDDNIIERDKWISELATQLKEVYPKGKKPGTNYYWSDSIILITKRLKQFFKKYDCDFNITKEQIINATKKYVDSFNGIYTYMQLLKYFIFKEKRNDIGEIESQSELLTYIENANEESLRRDFSEMRYE